MITNMDLKNMKKLDTVEQYEAVRIRVDELIREASAMGMLESEYDNEYTREIGRLANLGADYENEYMEFKYLKVRKKTPLTKKVKTANADLLFEYA
jgi:hypothetical protein